MQVEHFISYDLKTWQNSKTWECQEEIKVIWLQTLKMFWLLDLPLDLEFRNSLSAFFPYSVFMLFGISEQ